MARSLRTWLPKWLTPARPRPGRRPVQLKLERFEDRMVPATFTVTNTANSGAGSLRQAIIDANDASGADTIKFSDNTTGGATNFYDGSPDTITLSSALAITDSVTIDGAG